MIHDARLRLIIFSTLRQSSIAGCKASIFNSSIIYKSWIPHCYVRWPEGSYDVKQQIMGKQSSIVLLVSNIQCQLGWWLRIDEHIFVVWATNQMINGELNRKGCRLLLKPNFLGYWLLLLSCEQWGWSFCHFFFDGVSVTTKYCFKDANASMVNAAFLFGFVYLQTTSKWFNI